MGSSTYTAQGMRENLLGYSANFARESGKTFEPLERYPQKVMQFLKGKGYKATDKFTACNLSHKTVGTLAGVGWIGRCAMLTTKEVGPALRLAVVLTNAPLECAAPITESHCPPDCTNCADVCPTNAVKGGLWNRGIHRDEFFDVEACKKGRSMRGFCGLCISVCKYAKKGLDYEDAEIVEPIANRKDFYKRSFEDVIGMLNSLNDITRVKAKLITQLHEALTKHKLKAKITQTGVTNMDIEYGKKVAQMKQSASNDASGGIKIRFIADVDVGVFTNWCEAISDKVVKEALLASIRKRDISIEVVEESIESCMKLVEYIISVHK